MGLRRVDMVGSCQCKALVAQGTSWIYQTLNPKTNLEECSRIWRPCISGLRGRELLKQRSHYVSCVHMQFI